MSTQPITPPPGAQSINQILSEARSQLHRLTPSTLNHELQSRNSPSGPTHIIDIRPPAQRLSEGFFDDSPPPKIHLIERNVLEWRLDPQSKSRIDEIVSPHGYETRIVVVCSEGYTSSLAARELHRLGLRNATDLEGGFWAWKRFLEGGGGGGGEEGKGLLDEMR